MGKTNAAAWLPNVPYSDDDLVILPLILEGSYTASELVSMSGCDFSDGLITDELFPMEKHAPIERVVELVEDAEDEDREGFSKVSPAIREPCAHGG